MGFLYERRQVLYLALPFGPGLPVHSPSGAGLRPGTRPAPLPGFSHYPSQLPSGVPTTRKGRLSDPPHPASGYPTVAGDQRLSACSSSCLIAALRDGESNSSNAAPRSCSRAWRSRWSAACEVVVKVGWLRVYSSRKCPVSSLRNRMCFFFAICGSLVVRLGGSGRQELHRLVAPAGNHCRPHLLAGIEPVSPFRRAVGVPVRCVA